MYNVWALQADNNLPYGSGNYRALAMLELDVEPDTSVDDHTWIIIARNVSEKEAEAVMDQYPQVARAKC